MMQSVGFDRYRFDVETCRLWSGAEEVRLTPKASAVLKELVTNAGAGRKEDALKFLERVFARGWGKRDWIDHDPDYDILRDDPRFKRLMEKLK